MENSFSLFFTAPANFLSGLLLIGVTGAGASSLGGNFRAGDESSRKKDTSLPCNHKADHTLNVICCGERITRISASALHRAVNTLNTITIFTSDQPHISK